MVSQVGENISLGMTIQMKATEQYFPVVPFIMLYKVVLTFESVNEILWCGHSNETPLETVQQYFHFFLPESLDPWPSLFSPCPRLRKLLSELAHLGTFLRTIALVSTSEFWSQNRGT